MHRGALFWGGALVLLGSLLFLLNVGVLTFPVGAVFWPVVLILIGIWSLLSFVRPRAGAAAEAVSIPLQGASKATVRVHHGAGQLHIDASADPGALVSGTFGGGLDQRVRQQGDALDVDLRPPEDFTRWAWPWGWSGAGALDWTLGLSRDVALTLDLNTGASQTRMDLSELKVSDLRLRTGASETHVTLPAAGVSRVRVEAGAASVVLRIPDGVKGKIRMRGALSDIAVDRERFPRSGDVYQSADFDTAPNRIEIDINMGVGSVKLI
jgi:hypothetical protein